jgi:hypothetical protein
MALPTNGGAYKVLTAIMATALITGSGAYILLARDIAIAVEVVKAKEEAIAKEQEEMRLWTIENDKRLRIMETEIAEDRMKLGLPHRNIASAEGASGGK